MYVSTRPISSGGTALNELWHGVLINVSCQHNMSLLKSTGFSLLTSYVGLEAHVGGASPLLTPGKRHSLQGLYQGQRHCARPSTSSFIFMPNKSWHTANTMQ